MNRLADIIISLFFPHRCPFCGKTVPSNMAICKDCAGTLPYVTGKTCPRCGRGFEFCHCRGNKFAFERCVSPLYYEGSVRKSIINFKFHAKQSSAAAYAALSAQMIKREYDWQQFDFITCVPLTKREFKKRGFNQSEVFARALSRKLGIPYKDALCKPRDVKPQRTLNSEERWLNTAGAFSAKGSFPGAVVLLIDDVITTGATLSDCARALKKAGAKQVFCATIACTAPNKINAGQ
ncbi:MAG: ComF family protein [[Clostridium] cellulosi]|nr:MAG: hypothetical protein DIU81_02740 [[Clostridium] cellulosi]